MADGMSRRKLCLLTRRSFVGLVGAGAASALVASGPNRRPAEFRIRTITAGAELRSGNDLEMLGAAHDFLKSASSRLSETYEVQTTRIATQPLARYLPSWIIPAGLDSIRSMDRFAADAGVMLSIGPALTADGAVAGFASFASELVRSTTNTNFSCFIASPEQGIHHANVRAGDIVEYDNPYLTRCKIMRLG